jgi:hypothetical protein
LRRSTSSLCFRLYATQHAVPYSLPLQPFLQDHVIELGKLGMDTLILSEGSVNLGRACHCISATLATLAANETCAGFIMDAPGGSIVRSVLALVEVRSRLVHAVCGITLS